VTARLCPAYDHTRLVDSTPATATYDDAPLTGGASLGDARYGIAVTADSVTPLGAVLRIHTGDLLAPGVPGGVAASVEDNAVRLSWSPASDNVGVTGYRVYRNGGRIATVAATSIVDAAPRDGAAYTVRAVDAAGNVGPASAPVTVRLPDRTPPTAAGAPTATLLSATAAEIAWTPASDDRGVAHYRVLIDGREVAAIAGTTHLLSGLAPGATYALAVVAVDAAGNAGPPAAGTLAVPAPPAPPASAPPAADAGRPAPVPAPAAPAWLRVEGTGPVALALRWAAATGARGVRGYEIHRNGVLVGTSRTPEFLDTGLTPGTAYTYLVRAYDGAGALGPATALTAVTRPQNLRLAVTQASVRRSGPRRWLVRLTVHTAERPRVRPACSYRVGLAAWRRCAFDGSGAARVISTLTVRRPAVVTVRAGDARTSVATVRHTVRP
jgi:chitodextrinase